MNFSQLSLGLFAVKFYGIFVGIAFGIGAWHFYKKAVVQEKAFLDFFVHHFWRWVVGGLLMGRLIGLALDPHTLGQFGWGLGLLFFWEGEIHFLTAGVTALALAFWDMKRHGFAFWTWLDRMMPSLFLTLVMVDMASFLTGAIYGKATSLPWGVRYETFGVDILTPVHPITLYALIFHAVLFRYFQRRTHLADKHPGRQGLWGLVLLSGFWTMMLFLRGGDAMMLGVFRVDQLLWALVFSILMVIYFRKSR